MNNQAFQEKALEALSMDLSRIQKYIDNKMIEFLYSEKYKIPIIQVSPDLDMDFRRTFIKFLHSVKPKKEVSESGIFLLVQVEFKISENRTSISFKDYIGISFPVEEDWYFKIMSFEGVDLL